MIFEDRIQVNPRLLRLKNPITNEVIDWEIQDLEPEEIIQEGTEINAAKLNALNGTELYNSAAGSDSTIPLSMNAGFFKRIVIQCLESRDNTHTSLEVFEPNGKYAMLYNVFEGASPYLFCGRILISGNQITWQYNNRVNIANGSISVDQHLKITKVTGYTY